MERQYEGFRPYPFGSDSSECFGDQTYAQPSARSTRSPRSLPHISQRRTIPTEPRGFIPKGTHIRDHGQSSSPYRKEHPVPVSGPAISKQGRKRKNSGSGSSGGSAKHLKKAAELLNNRQPNVTVPVQGWRKIALAADDTDSRGKSTQRRGGGFDSNKSEGFGKRSHSEQPKGQSYGQGEASRSQSVASWNRTYNPNQHMRFT
jgi:hypothetical protein